MHGVPLNCQYGPLLAGEESYSRDNRACPSGECVLMGGFATSMLD